MTSHHDVAVLVAELRDLAAEQTLKCWEPRHGDWMRALKKSAEVLESQAKALSEVEASLSAMRQIDGLSSAQIKTLVGQKTEWMDRALAAEAILADIDRIVHVPTPSGEKADHHFQRDFDAIRKLTAPFRAFTNAAKEKT